MTRPAGAAGLRPALLAAVVLLSGCAAASSQPQSSPRAAPRALDAPAPGDMLLLPAGHWARDALRSLAIAGATDPALDRSDGTLALADAYAAFRDAAADTLPAAPLATGHLTRLVREVTPAGRTRPRRMQLRAGAGLESDAGRLRAGTETFNEADRWNGPRAVADRTGAAGRLTVQALPAAGAALALTAAWDGAGARVVEGYAAGRWRNLSGWAGRRATSFGPGRGGAIIAGGRESLDGVGLHSARAFRLPGPLRAAGALHVEANAGRLDGNAGVDAPWLALLHATLRPHPRLVLGATRGVMFGRSAGDELRPESLLRMLLGRHATDDAAAENQIAALHALYRPPVDLPLRLYGELGFEDSAGAWRDVPAVIAGVEVAVHSGVAGLAGLVGVTAGLERTSFAASCCGNPPWYRHLILAEGWTDRGRLLGHPLGGHGVEWLLHADVALAPARARLRATAFHRRRGAENLFAPEREGRAVGGSAAASLELAQGRELFLLGDVESGDGWTQHGFAAGLRLLF